MSILFIDLKTQYQALKRQLQVRIEEVLEHGQYIMGPEVKELEEKLAEFTGAKHCITCASGTEALLISLMALGIKPGDEIITTPFTFVAAVEVIVLLGAKPVFVDVEADTGNIDASLVEAVITPQTKAIIPVSLYGQPADMDEINAIASRHGNLPVIEDAAQSFGATYKGRKSCNLSTVGCTSFFPSKPLGCYGDGGAIFTNDNSLAQSIREIRVHGQSKRYLHTRVGVGGRMDTLQCAILLAKFERFAWELRQRAIKGQDYTKQIESSEVLRDKGIIPMTIRPERTSTYAQYTLLVPNRELMQKRLEDTGVPTAVHYPIPLDEQPAYKHLRSPAGTPIASYLSKRVMSLPMSADLCEKEQVLIIQAMSQAV